MTLCLSIQKMEYSLADWEKLSEVKSKKMLTLRADIQHSFDKIKVAVQQLESEDAFSLDTLNSRLSKGTSDTINSFFKAKMNSLLQEERIGSYNYYSDTLNAIERLGGKNILVSSVTVEWLKKLEKKCLIKVCRIQLSE